MAGCVRTNRLLILVAAATAASIAVTGAAGGGKYNVPHGWDSLLQTSTVQRQARKPVARRQPQAAAPRRVQPKISKPSVIRRDAPRQPMQGPKGPGSPAPH